MLQKKAFFRKMLQKCNGKFYFDCVLADSWYSFIENVICFKEELKKDFIMAFKSDRKIALSKEYKENNKYVVNFF